MIDLSRIKTLIAALLVALAAILGATACNMGAPSCPAGQVAEYDDDGYECEPDADGNGIDDEED